MTRITLLDMAEKKPCSVFTGFLSSLGRKVPDDTTVGIPEFLEHLNLVDALWSIENVDAYHKEKRLFQAWCCEQLLPHLTEPKGIDAVQSRIESLRDDTLSDLERALTRDAIKLEDFPTATQRSIARVASKEDAIKVAESAAWVSRKTGCNAADFEKQASFLMSLS